VSLTRPIDKWNDLKLEDELNQLAWTIGFYRNLAYATHDPTHSEAIHAFVRQQQDQLTKLQTERDHRITQGSYRPFLRAS
jgi:hypothetical protein